MNTKTSKNPTITDQTHTNKLPKSNNTYKNLTNTIKNHPQNDSCQIDVYNDINLKYMIKILKRDV